MLMLVAPPAAFAQEGVEKLLGQHLFPPELVMQHQRSIELKPAQRTAITEAIQQVQAKVVELQWRIQEEAQKLSELVQATSPNEEAVLAQMDRVLATEREIKRAHMTLLVRIKKALTREQQAALRALM
jgi:Spy/CpxP family protein refolding chaperone